MENLCSKTHGEDYLPIRDYECMCTACRVYDLTTDTNNNNNV